MSKIGTKLALIGAPVLEVVIRPIADLHPHPRNARTHSKKQVAQVAASMREFGFTAPLLLGPDNEVLAGHCRLEAAKLNGMTTVPTITLGHLTPSQLRAYLIADNRLSELAGWDLETLALELKDLSSLNLGFHLEITGFDGAELDGLLEVGAVGDEADEFPPPAGPAVSRLGDLWSLGEHRLVCGDARDRLAYDALMGRELARMSFTDPPYNLQIAGNISGKGKVKHENFMMASSEMSRTEFKDFLEESMAAIAAVSMDGSIHYFFMDWRHVAEIMEAGALVFDVLKNLIVWVKNNGGQGSFYRSQHELAFVFKHGNAPHINNFGLGETGRYRTNVWRYPGVNTFGTRRETELSMHPTVKPVAMIADAIRDVSKRGEVVLDAFAGSGSTLIAAEKTRRRARLIELDPKFVDTIVRRWMAFSGQPAILASTGQTFDEVAAERGAFLESR